MKNLRILLSFDYELSLGGCKSYAKNLFDPTTSMLRVAAEVGVPVTLFADVLCAIRFRQWDYSRFYQPFVQQLQDALYQGHDIQLHLHPHWLDSHYEEPTFHPAAASYSLAAFQNRASPNDIPGIVKLGVEFLNSVAHAKRNDYRCVAFRAGGYCLTPATEEILTALYGQGIRIESSIAKGHYLRSHLWTVDHRDMPAHANWIIGPQGPLNRVATTGLYEIPIAASPRTPVNNLPFLLKRLFASRRSYDSGGWPIDEGRLKIWEKARRVLPTSVWLLGFDVHTHTARDLLRIIEYHVDTHPADSLIACSAISHPKMMGPYACDLMRAFVIRARKRFGDGLEFCTYQQFYEQYLGVNR